MNQFILAFFTVFLFQAAFASDFCTVTLQEEDPGVSNFFRYQTKVEMLDCTGEVPQLVTEKMRISDSRVFKSMSTISKIMDSEGWQLLTVTNTVNNRFVLIYQK